MTAKKGEDETNKSAVKLQVALCRDIYLKIMLKYSKKSGIKKYYVCKKNNNLNFYITNVILYNSVVKV